jgi:hypothetical protein
VNDDRMLEVLSVNLSLFPLVLKGPHLTNRILFRSSGLTNGILDEKDIVEESPRQTEDKQDADDQENGSGERNVSFVSRVKAEIKFLALQCRKNEGQR